ncbi:MAG: bifunctional adenosylcobinamide kinase/adenosylcobinamide-phosphate guanylyltransferase [Rikenellaceae bacterium]
MRRIIYISGGQRSGKSNFAQNMAESLSSKPTYLATARCWDKEFEQRIARHKASRDERWNNIEEERFISKLHLDNEVVLMDCVTLWLTNIFCDNDYNLQQSLDEAKREWDLFINREFTLIVVSNEIGLGVVPMESSTRAFVDLQGWMNQHIASTAEEAYTVISGIPVKIKGITPIVIRR